MRTSLGRPEEGEPSALLAEDVAMTRFEWRGVPIEVRHDPHWLNTGSDHLEIAAAPRTPLPITETGYRSHFMDPADLASFEDAAGYVRAWLEDAANNWDGQLSLL